MISIESIAIADEPEAWEHAGFRVGTRSCPIGSIRLDLLGREAGRGIVSWSLRGLDARDLDGLPTVRSDAVQAEPASPHPNGAATIDHVVAFTPLLSRATDALEAAGLDLRRVREGPTPAGAERQAFFRLGEAILELVEHPPGTRAAEQRDAPSRFWGLALIAPDLDATAAFFGDRIGEPRGAVQPGRRIATLRRQAGLSVPLAFITPPVAGLSQR